VLTWVSQRLRTAETSRNSRKDRNEREQQKRAETAEKTELTELLRTVEQASIEGFLGLVLPACYLIVMRFLQLSLPTRVVNVRQVLTVFKTLRSPGLSAHGVSLL